MRVFLDANVLFSAAISPGGASAALVKLAAQGACVLVTSAFALMEAERNLAAKAPTGPDPWRGVRGAVRLVPDADPTLATRVAPTLPAKDLPILSAALACRADLFATGDRRHFGALYGAAGLGRTLVLPPCDAVPWILDALDRYP